MLGVVGRYDLWKYQTYFGGIVVCIFDSRYPYVHMYDCMLGILCVRVCFHVCEIVFIQYVRLHAEDSVTTS